MHATALWQPVLPSHQLRAADNIVGALVQGQELALWRSVDGRAQAWENRCPHRGVRLTLGRIVNGRLACGYHGWEYAAGSGRCEAIPAMPEQPVPGRVCVSTYPVIEALAMVWVNTGGADTDATTPTPGLAPGPTTLPDAIPATASAAPAVFCRTLALRADLDRVHEGLLHHGLHTDAPSTWHGSLASQAVRVFTLCAAPDLSFLHLWCTGEPDAPALHVLFAAARRLRAEIECGATARVFA